MKVDLEWNDDHVVPPKVTPDLEFLFNRMVEATIEQIDPSRGNRVLDIGCGRAVDAIKIAHKGGDPVGLEPSRTMIGHSRKCVADSGTKVALVQGIGENLPFKSGSFDWVMCKGALDHFPDPYKTMEEIARVLKPQGRAVIALANFESLGHRMGRKTYQMTRFLHRKKEQERQAWEMPPDHTYRFDYALIKDVVNSQLKIEKSVGISLLWGAPMWHRTVSILPRRLSFFLIGTIDRLAYYLPGMSDVVIVKCCQKRS